MPLAEVEYVHWSPVTRSLHFTCAVPTKSEKSNMRLCPLYSPVKEVSPRGFLVLHSRNSRGYGCLLCGWFDVFGVLLSWADTKNAQEMKDDRSRIFRVIMVLKFAAKLYR